MNRLSALDCFGPALERVASMLFRPFRLGTWLKIGFIGMLGGGVARINNSFNFRGPIPRDISRGQFPNDPFGEISRALNSIHLSDYLPVIMAVLAGIVVVSLVFLYLFCRFRFVLFDSVITGQPWWGAAGAAMPRRPTATSVSGWLSGW